MTGYEYDLRAEVEMAAFATRLDAGGGSRAARFYEAMDSAAARLAEFPGIGRRREQSGMGVRTWLVDNRWQLLYDSTSMPIRILRVTWAVNFANDSSAASHSRLNVKRAKIS